MMRAAGVVLSLSLAGCVKMPETYAPPMQREPAVIQGAGALKTFIEVKEPGAEAHFVNDISGKLEAGAWRWTYERPALVFASPAREGVRFVADVTAPDVSFAHTGPVTIRVWANGQEIGAVSLDKPGEKHIDIRIPDGWVREIGDNVIVMQQDKHYEAGGRKHGFVLTRAGLVK